MSGLHSRIGDRRKRDAAISIEQMLAIQQLLELEWREAIAQQDKLGRRRIAETACFFLIGYCGSMWGFELPKALLTNLRHSIHLEEGPHGHQPHAGIIFLGRFKARSNAEKKILVFLAAVVSSSGLQSGLWIDQLLNVLDECGILSGWLFQSAHSEHRPMSSFSEESYRVMFATRGEDSSLFEPTMDILEDYHLA